VPMHHLMERHRFESRAEMKDTNGYSEPRNGETQIGDYAIIGDCGTAALVSLKGSIDWLCLPHFSGPSVFAALLDQARGGRFRIRPEGRFRSVRRYCGPTAVLETTFETPTGSARVIDAMPVVQDSRICGSRRSRCRNSSGRPGRTGDWCSHPRAPAGAAAPRRRSKPPWASSNEKSRPEGAACVAVLGAFCFRGRSGPRNVSGRFRCSRRCSRNLP
jgi:hypothetical protein